ncbi:MAG: hypothetical protein HKN35_14715 [Woeseia sp.]|nr:hypothetical protein [Woeseia sp.]
MNLLRTLFAASAMVLLTAAAIADDHDDSNNRNARNASYVVTVTNASGTTFTPLLVVAHQPSIQLFEVGAAPSEPLAEIAESGSTAGFEALLATIPDLVGDVETTEGLLAPGASVQIELEASRRVNHLSLAAMLLPTNDSFVGLQSVALPRLRGTVRSYHALGYDAGSETNDELCANIPGPQCMGAGPSPDDTGEGYVRVSPGIAGTADLSSSDYDWRNPVAIVTVERVR